MRNFYILLAAVLLFTGKGGSLAVVLTFQVTNKYVETGTSKSYRRNIRPHSHRNGTQQVSFYIPYLNTHLAYNGQVSF